MVKNFSIKVYKQYFNFSSSHFLIFKDGQREPLHGHNYRVFVEGEAPELVHDLVFDFLDIKPIVRDLCNELDHKLLLPKDNPYLKISQENQNYLIQTQNGFFSIPISDVLILPISNTSAERLAIYLAKQLELRILHKYNFKFTTLNLEVEETPGQSASYTHQGNEL